MLPPDENQQVASARASLKPAPRWAQAVTVLGNSVLDTPPPIYSSSFFLSCRSSSFSCTNSVLSASCCTACSRSSAFLPNAPMADSSAATRRASAAISSSYTVHSGISRLARWSFGSWVTERSELSVRGIGRVGCGSVRGLLQRSIVLACASVSSLHQVSHHSQLLSSVCCRWRDKVSQSEVARALRHQSSTASTYDGNGALHVVWEVLIEVGERVGVGREALVLLSQAIASCYLAEAVEVDEVEGAVEKRSQRDRWMVGSISSAHEMWYGLPLRWSVRGEGQLRREAERLRSNSPFQ